jgi:hypothetical protein
MLGMVFTEFIEMVESRFSPELADSVIAAAALPHGGAYTAVGYYPHAEMLALLAALSERSGIAVADLVCAFGEHLLGRFVAAYPQMFSARANLFDFLASIDGEIHREVRKLYPAAQLPRFTVLARSARQLTLAYESPRGMEALALGLMRGAARHYREAVQISQAPAEFEGRAMVRFQIDRQP